MLLAKTLKEIFGEKGDLWYEKRHTVDGAQRIFIYFAPLPILREAFCEYLHLPNNIDLWPALGEQEDDTSLEAGDDLWKRAEEIL